MIGCLTQAPDLCCFEHRWFAWVVVLLKEMEEGSRPGSRLDILTYISQACAP